MSSENFVTRAEFEAAIGGLENKFGGLENKVEGLENKFEAFMEQSQLQFQQMMEFMRTTMQPPQAGENAGQILQKDNATSGEGLGASGRPRIDIEVENLVGGASLGRSLFGSVVAVCGVPGGGNIS